MARGRQHEQQVPVDEAEVARLVPRLVEMEVIVKQTLGLLVPEQRIRYHELHLRGIDQGAPLPDEGRGLLNAGAGLVLQRLVDIRKHEHVEPMDRMLRLFDHAIGRPARKLLPLKQENGPARVSAGDTVFHQAPAGTFLTALGDRHEIEQFLHRPHIRRRVSRPWRSQVFQRTDRHAHIAKNENLRRRYFAARAALHEAVHQHHFDASCRFDMKMRPPGRSRWSPQQRIWFGLCKALRWELPSFAEELANRRARIPEWIAAATSGDVDAQLILAWEYARGDAIDADIAAAGDWFERAAASGREEAQVHGARFLQLRGVPEGVRELRRLAARNNWKAEFWLARHYQSQAGRLNQLRAVVWYDRSFKNGNPAARLGKLGQLTRVASLPLKAVFCRSGHCRDGCNDLANVPARGAGRPLRGIAVSPEKQERVRQHASGQIRLD